MSGEALQMKQGILETVEDPMTPTFLKEDVSVVKDLPCALNSMNELFALSTALSTFSSQFAELQQHLDFIKSSIDNIYKLQTINESEVVMSVPEPNVSTSVSSAVTVLSSSDKMDGQRPQCMEFIGDTVDNMLKVQNAKELEVVTMASEPKGSTSVSAGDPILSLTDQIAKQSDNGKTYKETSYDLHNVEESEVVVVPEPNASISSPSDPPVLSSPSPVVGSSDDGETCNEVWCTTLEKICTSNTGNSLRQYIRSNRSDIERLREEGPKALMRAPNPAEFVLAAIGQFYLQTRRAYKKCFAYNIYNRQACLLILEFFLLSGCTSIEPSIKMEAEITAVSWRSRLLSEDGYRKAKNDDARGLLLFVASYGIPSCFTNEDLMELIRLSNVWEISDALQRSQFLKGRISDIIQEMVDKKIVPGAVEAACSFGLEEKFPPETILSSFLQESKQAWKRDTFSQPSTLALIDANDKHLDAFKKVAKCLVDCKISPSKLEEWNINTEIANLEKVVEDLYLVIEKNGKLKNKDPQYSDTFRKIKRLLKRKQKFISNLKAKQRRKSNGAPTQMQNAFMLPQEQTTFHSTGGNTFYDGGHLDFAGCSVVSSAPPSSVSGTTGPDLHRTFPGNVAETRAGHGPGGGSPLGRTVPGNVTEVSAGRATWTGDAFHRTAPRNITETSVGHAVGGGVAILRTPPAKVAETSLGHAAGVGLATHSGIVAETSAGHAVQTRVATNRTPPGNVSEAGVWHAAGTGIAFHCSGNVVEGSVLNARSDGDAVNVKDPKNSTNNLAGSFLWHKGGILNHNSNCDTRRHPSFFAPPALEQSFSGQPSTNMGGDNNSRADLYSFADSF